MFGVYGQSFGVVQLPYQSLVFNDVTVKTKVDAVELTILDKPMPDFDVNDIKLVDTNGRF